MFIYTLKFDKKKAVFAVVVAALLIVGIILLVGALHKRAEARAGISPAAAEEEISDLVKNEKARVRYLAEYGWEVQTPAESESTVVIPRTFSPVFDEYNALQKQQGFDLSRYCGAEVKMFTYRVTNSGDDEVLAVLYVKDNRVIGGDVHSTALDGFMSGIKKS